MKFKDHRKPQEGQDLPNPAQGHLSGGRFTHYLDEIIEEARRRGEFDNLANEGKPLRVEEEAPEALAQRMLKSNETLPPELQRIQLIREKRKEADTEIAASKQRYLLIQASETTSPGTKHAQRERFQQAIQRYEIRLKEINSLILTQNITAPSSMHQAPLNLKVLVQAIKEETDL